MYPMTALEYLGYGIRKTLAHPILIFLGLLSTTLSMFPEVIMGDEGFLGWGILLVISPMITAGSLSVVHRLSEGEERSLTPFFHGVRRFSLRLFGIGVLLGIGGILLLLGFLFLNLFFKPFLLNLTALLIPLLIFPLIVLWDVIVVVEDWPLNEALASAVDAGKARYKTMLALFLLSALLSPFTLISSFSDIFHESPLLSVLLHPLAILVYLVMGSFFFIVFLFTFIKVYKDSEIPVVS